MKTKATLMALAGAGGIGSASAVTLTAGELDFGAALEGGGFEIEAHAAPDGEPAIIDGNPVLDTVYEVDDMTVEVGNGVQTTLGSDSLVRGVLAGESIWILPEAEVDGVPFVALASEELTAADWLTNITFTLGTVVPPEPGATFSAWYDANLITGDPEVFHFSSTNGAGTNDNNQFESDFGHHHMNWGFTAPGLWEIPITASGTHSTLGFQETTATLTFNVIPEPSTGMMTLLSVVGLSLVRRRK